MFMVVNKMSDSLLAFDLDTTYVHLTLGYREVLFIMCAYLYILGFPPVITLVRFLRWIVGWQIGLSVV